MAKTSSITIKILKWILKEFKGEHAGDYLEVTQHAQEKEFSQGDYRYFITETKISFRTEHYEKDLTPERMQQMRDELNELTENSVKKLEFLESTAARYTNQSELPQSGGSALLLKIEIFHKERL